MTAQGPNVSHAMTGPGKNAETILSRRDIIKTERGRNRHILKYLC